MNQPASSSSAPGIFSLGPSPLSGTDAQLSVAQAQAAIRAALQPVQESGPVSLRAALGRVLAFDVISPINVPAHDNSAMDGYAFAGASLQTGAVTELRVVGTVLAGQTSELEVAAHECVRIMTGAVMPAGLDTVVPQELCEHDPASGRIRIAAGVLRAGENRRRAGEDLTLGKPALQSGRRLRPADLGLLASLGLTEVVVRRRLRVAVFSTGDELAAPGEPLLPGCVYDSNRSSLIGALDRLGCEVIDLGRVPDDPQALASTFERAVAEADAVVTSGGVSVGDADYTRDLLARLGEVSFWKVAMRPGRPFAFGPLHTENRPGRPVWLFALPGNPVAALVTFHVFAQEALLQLGGARTEPPIRLRARSAVPIRKRPGRTEFQRARVRPSADGGWEVSPSGTQGAGVLRSMCEANALLVLGHDQGSVAAGEWVEVWLFEGMV